MSVLCIMYYTYILPNTPHIKDGISTRLIDSVFKLVAHKESEVWTSPSHSFTKEGLLQLPGRRMYMAWNVIRIIMNISFKLHSPLLLSHGSHGRALDMHCRQRLYYPEGPSTTACNAPVSGYFYSSNWLARKLGSKRCYSSYASHSKTRI